MKHDLRLLLLFVGACALICAGLERAVFDAQWEGAAEVERRDVELDAAIRRLHVRVQSIEGDVETSKRLLMMQSGVVVPASVHP